MSERTRKKWRRVKQRLHFAAAHLDGFKSWLRDIGYAASTIDEVVRLLADWTDWMHAAGFTFDTILAGYDASAAIFRGNKTAKAPFGAAALFIRYLRAEGVLCQPIRPASPAETWPILGAFGAWMRHHGGLSETTLDTYQRVIIDLLEVLGDDPAAFTAYAIRAFVLERAKPHSSATWWRPGNARPGGNTPFRALPTGSWRRSRDSWPRMMSREPLPLARAKAGCATRRSFCCLPDLG
jgi:integrase/recombinase XerD